MQLRSLPLHPQTISFADAPHDGYCYKRMVARPNPITGGAMVQIDDKQVRANLENLVGEHRKLKNEPLHLAVWFVPSPGDEHIYLFEIIGGFGAGTIDENRQILQFAFGMNSGFSLKINQELRILLTSPEEFSVAISEGWDAILKLREAKSAQKYCVLYADRFGKRFWEAVR